MAVKHTFLYKDNTQMTKELTPIKAIREKCMECYNWQYSEVTKCPATDCALWVYRMGKRPKDTAE